MFTPQENDDVIGILREYNDRAIVTNPALIEETWVNSDVEIPNQTEYDAARTLFLEKLANQVVVRDEYNTALSEGWTLKPGVVLSVGDASRVNIDTYSNHLDREYKAGNINLGTVIQIPDINKVNQYIKYGEFVTMLLPYGRRCLEVFNMKP
jgi:hypothetical protein